MSAKKLQVGPLPKQVEDYSHLEETDIRWDRVAMFGFAACVLVFGLVYALLPSSTEPDSKPALAQEQVETPSKKDVVMPPIVNKEESKAMSIASKPVTDAKVDEPKKQAVASIELKRESTAQQELMTKNPIAIIENGIVHAQLTSNVVSGQPVDRHGSLIPMSDEGIIKVVLYNEFQNIRGTTLYHDWYQGEKRVARVKIPVSREGQRSISSKFINKQMLGQWTVKVVDKTDKLYMSAEFKVQ